MKRRYLLLLLIAILILPSKIKAICDDSEVSLMQQYSKDVTYNYTYTEKNDAVTFDITFTNLKRIISIKNPLDGNYYTDYNEITIRNLQPNKGYNFEIYSSSLCPSEPLKTLYITMPGYNKYYKDKICEGLEDFKYCQKWINLPFGYDRLKNEIDNYKKKQENKQKKEEKSNSTQFGKIISMIFSKNGLVVLSIIITLGVVVMVLRDRKSNLN